MPGRLPLPSLDAERLVASFDYYDGPAQLSPKLLNHLFL